MYRVEVKVNGWCYRASAGDMESAERDAAYAVEKFGIYADVGYDVVISSVKEV